jgi:hypothetical protein
MMFVTVALRGVTALRSTPDPYTLKADTWRDSRVLFGGLRM